MSEHAGERTEQATGRRREEARQRGQVASSREFSAVATFTATALAGSLAGASAFGVLTTTMRRWLAGAGGTTVSEATMPTLAMEIGRDILILAVPFGLILLAMGVCAQILQTGWVWSTARLEWDPGRLNPITGIKRLASLRSLAELVKAIFKILVIGTVVYWNLKDEMLALPLMLHMEPEQALFRAGGLALSLTMWVAGVMAVLAGADYAFQRWHLGRDLRMTREEVKREQKESEGDPLIKSRIRTLQRQGARRRMMQDVPKADVVITNPTHIAVALRYDGVRMGAPVVVAKGAGFIAERIRQVAAEHGVPLFENKPLARSLHKLVDVGREIPAELYQAVAEILALVMRAKGTLGAGRAR